jgi:hypothetical protein
MRAALGFGLLGMAIGGALALIAGLGFTALAGTDCLAGFCAHLPTLWFAPLGLVAGFALGAKLGSGKAGA